MKLSQVYYPSHLIQLDRCTLLSTVHPIVRWMGWDGMGYTLLSTVHPVSPLYCLGWEWGGIFLRTGQNGIVLGAWVYHSGIPLHDLLFY